MKKILLIFFILAAVISCSKKVKTFGAGYGKVYDNEPNAVIDSVLATRGLTQDDLKWSTRQYADEMNGVKTTVTASTALYRMQNDSTIVMTLFSYNGKYRLIWRVEKEAKINY